MRQIGRRDLLLGLGSVGVGALGGSVFARNPLQRALRPPLKPKLNKNRAFGTAITPAQLRVPATTNLVSENCRFIVPEYHCQWSAIEWQRGEPWYGDLDSIINYARAHDLTVRGHSLIWEQMTPEWAKASMMTEGWAVVRRHFADMLTRYDEGVVPEWIVVNECIDTETGDQDLRRTSFQRAFGQDYVSRAFETAREIAPNAKLFINDYSLEYDNPVDARRRKALLRLVGNLKRRGLIDGVGIQAHLELAKGPLASKALAHMLAELHDMDLAIGITELDVLEDNRRSATAVRDQQVADATTQFLDIVDAQPAVTSLATWGLFDQQSWLQDRHPETKLASAAVPPNGTIINRGLPFAVDHRPKAMWEAVQKSTFV